MKSVVIALMLVGFSLIGYSQNYRQGIEDEFGEYLDALRAKDIDRAMNYVTPKLFEFVPRDVMVKAFAQLFEDPEIEYNFREHTIMNVGEPEQVEGLYYALLNYSGVMEMKYNDLPDDKSERKETIKLTTGLMEATFGKGNVKFDSKNNTFEIKSMKEAYAISADGVNDWKFMVLESKQGALAQKILPQELYNRHW